jgi:hypothetical protein
MERFVTPLQREKFPVEKSSEKTAAVPETVIGAEAWLRALVFVPSPAVTSYVWVLSGVSPESWKETVVVDELVTVPTAVEAPSRYTA